MGRPIVRPELCELGRLTSRFVEPFGLLDKVECLALAGSEWSRLASEGTDLAKRPNASGAAVEANRKQIQTRFIILNPASVML